MLRQNVYSGDAEIVASGSVISFNGEPITVKFTSNEFIFDFKAKEKNEVDAVGKTAARISLGGIVNGGSREPVALGENEQSVLYLMFHISRPVDDVIQLIYTFYARPANKADKEDGKLEKKSKK